MRFIKGNRRRGGPGWGARLQLWLLALVIGAAAGWWGRDFALESVAGPERVITRVAVTGNQRVGARELVAAAGLSAELPITAVDVAEVRAALTRHPWVREARVTMLLPGHVIVAVEERTPVAVAVLGEEMRFVDATGTPFAVALEPEALPELVGVASADPNRPHPLFAQALHLLEAAAREELPAPARILLGGRPMAELPAITWTRPGSSDLTAVLGAENPNAGLARLAQAWMADLPELRMAREVDLRFGDQLILRGSATQGDDESEDRGRAANAAVPSHSHSRGG